MNFVREKAPLYEVPKEGFKPARKWICINQETGRIECRERILLWQVFSWMEPEDKKYIWIGRCNEGSD